MKKATKKVRLIDFMAAHGATSAEALLGVSTVTLWRWQTKRTKPKRYDARRLDELGVEVR